MKVDLDESACPDDLTVKKYNQDLVKFLNTKRKIVEEAPIRSVEVEVTKDQQIETPQSQPTTAKTKRKRKVSVPSTRTHLGRPKRVRKTPRKFAWDEL